MAATDNKLDPFTVITNVNWPGSALGVLVCEITEPDANFGSGFVSVPIPDSSLFSDGVDSFTAFGDTNPVLPSNPVTAATRANTKLWQPAAAYYAYEALQSRTVRRSVIIFNLAKIKATNNIITLAWNFGPLGPIMSGGTTYWLWESANIWSTLAQATDHIYVQPDISKPHYTPSGQASNLTGFSNASDRDAAYAADTLAGLHMGKDDTTTNATQIVYLLKTSFSLYKGGKTQRLNFPVDGQDNPLWDIFSADSTDTATGFGGPFSHTGKYTINLKANTVIGQVNP